MNTETGSFVQEPTVAQPMPGELLKSPDMGDPPLHPLQLFAVDANYARGFWEASRRDAKQELPWLMGKNPDPDADRRDVGNLHVLGLYDAYQAKLSGVSRLEAVRRLDYDSDGRGDYLLGKVEGILPRLDAQREEALSAPGKIQPYDVHLAERRIQRLMVGLPDAQRESLSQMSGVSPQKLGRRVAERAFSVAAGTASAFASDAVAGAVGFPVERAHWHWLEGAPIGLLIAAELSSYGSLGYGIAKNALAQVRLSRETGSSINVGAAGGDLVAGATGGDEAKRKKASILGQSTFETVKDVVENVGILTAVRVGALSVRDALILSTAATFAAGLYEGGVAKVINRGLDVRRNFYNSRHPF